MKKGEGGEFGVVVDCGETMGQLFQIQQLSSALNLRPYSFSCKLTPMAMAMPPFLSSFNRSPKFPSISSPKLNTTLNNPLFLFRATRSRLLCKINDSGHLSLSLSLVIYKYIPLVLTVV